MVVLLGGLRCIKGDCEIHLFSLTVFTHCFLLSKSLSFHGLYLCLLVLRLKISGSVDLLLDLVLCLLLPVCLQVLMLAFGSTYLVLVPWLVEWVEWYYPC
jgi:hypothetical protein